MKMMEERELADALLVEWYDWTAAYRPSLGDARTAVSCRQALSSRQYDDSTEASCARLHINEMQAIAFCVDQLPVAQQVAIGIEMRNRGSRSRVWRNNNADTYENAVEAIRPLMRRRGLFDGK